MEAFINAIFEKDRVTVEALVQDPQIDVNAKLGSYGKTVLHYACQYGWTRVVELLLARPDIQVNIQDEDGNTPLMYTCQSESNGDITKLLLEYPGINVNQQNFRGFTALYLAIEYEKDEQQEYLLNYPGINVNVQTTFTLRTALHKACFLEKEGLVQKLLSFPEINVNLQDDDGRTALMHSCKLQFLIIAELLLKHPTINVNLQDNEGGTALMLLNSDNAAFLSNLLSRPEILIDLVDNENQTALFYGIFNLNLYKVRLLIAKGANVNIRNSDGNTPLIIACMRGTSDMTPYVEAILSRPIDDINLAGIRSFNALHRASSANNPVILQLLLSQKGILVNFLDNLGRTPLILACSYGRIENVRILLKFPGIDVNHIDFDGQSALGYALEYELEKNEGSEIIRMLIFHGAKYYLKDVIQYYPEFKEISTLAKLYKGEIYEEGMQTRYKRQRVENQQSNTQIATTMDIYAVQVLDGLLRSLRLQIPSRIDTSHNFQEVLRYIKTYYYDPIRDEEGNLVYENGEVTFRLI